MSEHDYSIITTGDYKRTLVRGFLAVASFDSSTGVLFTCVAEYIPLDAMRLLLGPYIDESRAASAKELFEHAQRLRDFSGYCSGVSQQVMRETSASLSQLAGKLLL